METFIGAIIALVIAIFIGQDAAKRGMNAWGWGIGVFLLLIVFLPLYFILRKPKLETVNQNIQKDIKVVNQETQQVEKPKNNNTDVVSEIEKLYELKQKGILTEEEYNNRKIKILNS